MELTQCQIEALDIARKKAKIHQNGLIYQIKTKLIELDINESFLEEFHKYINDVVPIVCHGKFTFRNLLDEPFLKSVY